MGLNGLARLTFYTLKSFTTIKGEGWGWSFIPPIAVQMGRIVHASVE